MPTLLSQSRRAAADTALRRGLAWLLQKQTPDGAWHSLTYGSLKDGAAVTSLAVYTLQFLPETDSPAIRDAISSAAKFLKLGFAKRHTIAAPDGSLDYPTYAAALILTAGRKFPSLAKEIPAPDLMEYLLQAQVTTARGFPRTSPDYGGWDLLGIEDAAGITTGTNVSVTTYALEALAEPLGDKVKAARQLALEWLLKAQAATGDGGFSFTADAQSPNNKALWRDSERRQPRSYGSPTCDGIQALQACGAEPDDPHIAAAAKWIVDHPAIEKCPGFKDLPPELGWSEGLKYYHAQSLARVLRHIPVAIAEDRADQLAKWLVAEQTAAGAWKNDSARMREDDPLLATCFVLTALAVL